MSAVPFAGPPSDAVRRDAAALVFVEDPLAPRPNDEDLHHLRDVLRLEAGERVICCDGKGSWRPFLVTAALSATRLRRGRSRLVDSEEPSELLIAEGPLVTEQPPATRLGVGFPLLKGDRTEWTVQKLTELGIDVITPLITARTVVRPDAVTARRRGERLRRVAREAAAQSRQVFLPEITDPVALANLDLDGVGLAEPGGAALDDALATIYVGPEGGWTSDELSRGAMTVSLGPSVLRAETAALVCGVLLAARRSGLLR